MMDDAEEDSVKEKVAVTVMMTDGAGISLWPAQSNVVGEFCR